MIGPEDAVIPKEKSLDEINAAIPRRVYLSGEGQTPLFAVLIFLLFALMWVVPEMYFTVQKNHDADALGREGREAIAKVTDISHHGRGSYYVEYTFAAAGIVYHGKAAVPDFQPIRVRCGDSITVLFLPHNPGINHPSGWGWWRFGDLVLAAIGLMFLGVSVNGLISVYQRWRLARIGWVTEAEVIACAPKRARFRVDYQFWTEDGTLFDGANEYSYDEYHYGTKIRVVYMRHNPKRNDMWPLSDFLPVE